MKKRKNAESDQQEARQGGLVDIGDHFGLFGEAVVDQLQGGLAPVAGVDSFDDVVFERLGVSLKANAVGLDVGAEAVPTALGGGGLNGR